MAKEIPPKEAFDDGLAPPPELPAPATSQIGTVAEAEALQVANNVPDRFRGAWYHETYTKLEAFDNQHEEWTWFTRSPSGGTIWGESVRQVYVIDAPENTKLHAASNKGDKDGYEGKDALPDWWMSVGREDIPKLMVVLTIDPKTQKANLESLFEGEAYKATRHASLERLQALKNPKPAGE
jgi:hypothetical protein